MRTMQYTGAETGECEIMKILIIDAQGGGIGRTLVEKISAKCKDAEIIVVGTNPMATANMLKGGRVSGATGENAVVFNCRSADVIVGPIGIAMANSMLGEITPKMAEAVTSSPARLILIPMNRCHAYIVGVKEKKVADYVEEAVEMLLSLDK